MHTNTKLRLRPSQIAFVREKKIKKNHVQKPIITQPSWPVHFRKMHMVALCGISHGDLPHCPQVPMGNLCQKSGSHFVKRARYVGGAPFVYYTLFFYPIRAALLPEIRLHVSAEVRPTWGKLFTSESKRIRNYHITILLNHDIFSEYWSTVFEPLHNLDMKDLTYCTNLGFVGHSYYTTSRSGNT